MLSFWDMQKKKIQQAEAIAQQAQEKLQQVQEDKASLIVNLGRKDGVDDIEIGNRLMQFCGMSQSDARQRLATSSSQALTHRARLQRTRTSEENRATAQEGRALRTPITKKM